MPKVAVFNVSGSQVGELELADSVFGIEPHAYALNQAVLLQRASLRMGTHKVKGRSEVRGGGRKLGNKKVRVVRVKVVSALRNGKAAASFSDRHLAAIRSNCQRKYVAWRLNPRCLPRCWQVRLSYWISFNWQLQKRKISQRS